MKTIADPHHPLDVQWKFQDGKFWHNQTGTKSWTEMKRVHITVERVKALNELIKQLNDEQ